MPRLLGEEEVKTRLGELDGWTYEDGFITKRFEFGRFLDGIAFINQVAAVAEKEEHHPDIHVSHTTVRLMVQSHSEGGVTEWDFKLAEAIDSLPVRGIRKSKRGRQPSSL